MIKATNEDIQNKLRAEKDNYDNLMREKMELEERLGRLKVILEIDTEAVKEQDELLAELKKQIEAEQAEVDALEEGVTEARKIKKQEEDRFRHVQQQYTALSAKNEFIEANYDYTTTPGELNLEIFKQIVQSNSEVNDTVEGFVTKVDGVKKEVTKILAQRYAF